MRRSRLLKTAIVLAGAAVVAYACSSTPDDPSPSLSSSWPGSMTSITVVTWNLGYGGLGEGSDFFADGGQAYLPPGPGATRESADAIAAWLGDSGADVVMTQENARPSVINFWTDLKGQVDRALPDHQSVFHADFQTRYLPPPLRISNGLGSYVRHGLSGSEIWPMPSDGDPYDGPLRRRYGALATTMDGPGGCWTFVNLHTSAFDEGGALRRRQLAAILERAVAVHASGSRVVIGGDFNMRLVQTDFAHTTLEEHLFWVHDLPTEVLPDGWRVVADPATPTVRTNERPYRAGENYTAVIDGFIVSPDVEVVSVTTADLGFRHSDHQPVRAVLRPRERPDPSACGAA